MRDGHEVEGGTAVSTARAAPASRRATTRDRHSGPRTDVVARAGSAGPEDAVGEQGEVDGAKDLGPIGHVWLHGRMCAAAITDPQ